MRQIRRNDFRVRRSFQNTESEVRTIAAGFVVIDGPPFRAEPVLIRSHWSSHEGRRVTVTNDCTIVTVNKGDFMSPEDFEGSPQQGRRCRDDFPEHQQRGVETGAVFPGKLPMHTMMFHREVPNLTGFFVLQFNCGTFAGLSKSRMHLFASLGGRALNSAGIDEEAAPGCTDELQA